MKVLVTVKRVVDPYAKVRALADGTGIDAGGAKSEINPFDEIAVEEAVRLKEAGHVTEIVAVSVGKSECEEQLRKALAMGADRAILLETDTQLDSLGVAKILASLVDTEKPDLILMGKQATDDDSNQVGQMLAGKLGIPQATFASKIVISTGGVQVTRETDAGEEVVLLQTPCLITADLRLNEPRYIALPGIIKARSKPLAREIVTTAPEAKTKTLTYANPPTRQAGKKVSSVDELLAEIKNRGGI